MNNQKGFTLLELLVVISIISLLATLATTALIRARMEARDTVRLADFKVLEKALEIYAINNDDNYPSFEDEVTSAPNAGWDTLLGPLLAPYISPMPYPAEPILGLPWHYRYNSKPATYSLEGNFFILSKGYLLLTRFEGVGNTLAQDDGGISSVYYEIFKGDYEIIIGP